MATAPGSAGTFLPEGKIDQQRDRWINEADQPACRRNRRHRQGMVKSVTDGSFLRYRFAQVLVQTYVVPLENEQKADNDPIGVKDDCSLKKRKDSSRNIGGERDKDDADQDQDVDPYQERIHGTDKILTIILYKEFRKEDYRTVICDLE